MSADRVSPDWDINFDNSTPAPKQCSNPECVECYGMLPYTQEQVDAMNAERERADIIDQAIRDACGVSATTATLISQMIERDAHGKAKYGTTLDRTDLSLADWLQHQAEELMDGAGYALAAKRLAERAHSIEQAAWAAVRADEAVKYEGNPDIVRDALDDLRSTLKRKH